MWNVYFQTIPGRITVWQKFTNVCLSKNVKDSKYWREAQQSKNTIIEEGLGA